MQRLQNSRARLLIGASVIALCATPLAAPAMAQTAAPAAAPAQETTAVVVVTARRKALQTATERKRNADTVVDSIVADEAGKLPDTSMTEVLQRVAGVTITRFASLGSPDQYSYEGTGIQVRGLSGVTGLLNGREIFSANGGGGLNWGDVTPELMAAVDVYKESTADLIEGGTGGAIDLRTHLPFDYKKPEIDFTVQDSYGEYVKRGSPSASVLVTDRWDTPIGEFGALVDLSYSEYKSADSFIRSEPYYGTLYQTSATATPEKVYVPGGFDWGEDGFDRKRKGVYAAFQWRPNSDLTIWQTDFYSNYVQTNTGGGVYAAFGGGSGSAMLAPGSATFTSNGIFLKSNNINPFSGGISPGSSDNYTPSDNSTADFSQGFIWTPTQKLRVSGALQVVDSGAFAGNYGYGLTTNVQSLSMDLTGDFPVDGFGPSSTAPNAPNGATVNATPTDAAVGSINWRENKNTATMEAGNLDVVYDLGDGFFKEFKAGVRYANQSETDNTVGTYWAGTDESWDYPSDQKTAVQPSATAPFAPKATPLFTLNQFSNFFQKNTSAPSAFWFVNPSLLRAGNFVALQNYFSTGKCSTTEPGQKCATDTIMVNGVPTTYTDQWDGTNIAYLGAPTADTTKTDKFDAYAEGKFGHDAMGWLPAFTGNLGVRVVSDWVTSAGPFVAGNSGTPNYYYPSVAAANAEIAKYGGLQGYENYLQTLPANSQSPGTSYLVYSSGQRVEAMHYTRVLPSVNIAFKPDSHWVVRFGASQTMSPPGYSDIQAQGSLGVNTTTNPNNGTAIVNGKSTTITLPGVFESYNYSAGNTHLKPALSTNEDISIEWYPTSSTTAHLDIFNKDIKDFFVYNPYSFNEVFSINNGGAVTTAPTPVTESLSENANKASTITGYELGGRTYFDFLPGPFKGIGIEANYTYIDSHAPGQIATDINGNPITGLPVVGLSRTSYNINFLYDLGNWDARLAYNWRSKYLATSTGNGTGNNSGSNSYQFEGAGPSIDEGLPVYASALGELDGSISYKINANLGLSLDATNLTDNVPKTYMELFPGEFVTRSWFISDRRWSLTLHAHF